MRGLSRQVFGSAVATGLLAIGLFGTSGVATAAPRSGPSGDATIAVDSSTGTVTGTFSWSGFTSVTSATVWIYTAGSSFPLAANTAVGPDPSGSLTVTYAASPGASGKYYAEGAASGLAGSSTTETVTDTSHATNVRCRA